MDQGSNLATDIDGVESLLEATNIAPAFGLNSRQLILRAARKVCTLREPDEHDQRNQIPARTARTFSDVSHQGQKTAESVLGEDNASINGGLAEVLTDSLTVHERPLVQYIPRSAVPRILRQV
jgi:hypothetical protein